MSMRPRQDKQVLYLWLVLDLHLSGRQQLRVDSLRHAREDLAPWCPDGDTELERAHHGEDNQPDDVPQVRVQEEQDEVHDIHDGERERDLVAAERGTEVLVAAVLHLGPRHDRDRAAERLRKEEVRLGELAPEDK